MDFSLSPEQQQLCDGISSWLADTLPAERIAALADGPDGWDPTTWKQVVDFGLLDLESLGTVELALAAEQLGAGLYAGPWLSCVTALPFLPPVVAHQVVQGSHRAGVAWATQPAQLQLTDGRLTGEVRHVVDIGAIDTVAVPLGEGQYAALRLDARGVQVIPHATTDRTRRRADLLLDNACVEVVQVSEPAEETARLRWLVLLAAESVGASQRALEITRDYVSERKQFDRIIGTYQAVSHKVADIYTRTELSRSLTYWAAVAIDAESIDAEDATHAAKAFACDGAVLSLEHAIQAHGGIGFTWEHVLHRYYKRVRANAVAGGSAQHHRQALAEAIFE